MARAGTAKWKENLPSSMVPTITWKWSRGVSARELNRPGIFETGPRPFSVFLIVQALSRRFPGEGVTTKALINGACNFKSASIVLVIGLVDF
jgi:hypothetical protein